MDPTTAALEKEHEAVSMYLGAESVIKIFQLCMKARHNFLITSSRQMYISLPTSPFTEQGSAVAQW